MSESAQDNIRPEVRITPAVRETTIPEINAVEARGKKWFQRFGKATHDSTVKIDPTDGNNLSERPLLGLVKRADFLKDRK